MRWLSRRILPVFGATALAGAGYLLGGMRTEPLAAQQKSPVTQASGTTAAAPQKAGADQRVIAYIYGNTPITREEFGDYLIQQFGAERVRLFVNRRIIEMAAAKKNVVVTPQEIDAIIAQDCEKIGVNKADFVNKVLKQKYGKTIQEWREDVIKPRLILQSMCRDQVKIEEEDLKKVHENMFGEKTQVKIIMWPLDSKQTAFKRYDAIRKDEAEFDNEARNQLSSDLAARGGLVDPIGRHSGPGSAKIEEIAFRLNPGQLSEVIETPAGVMVIKCVKKIPARTDVNYEAVKPMLIRELTDRLLEQEVPKAFSKLNEEAKPLFLLNPADISTKEVEDQSKRILGAETPK